MKMMEKADTKKPPKELMALDINEVTDEALIMDVR